jgi:prolyl-tRNA editing enzyme YbaK/EbsC (Cys-tRNA(Pro) deacylase)
MHAREMRQTLRVMKEPSILHDRVREALDAAEIAYEILPCEPELADTAAFCEHYNISTDEACNAILVAVKTEPRRYVACLVRADTKLDVNRKLAGVVGTKRLSFASSEETATLTGMLIGGVSIAGLPAGVPLYIDLRVLERPHIIIGGGNRHSKARLDPKELLKLRDTHAVDIAEPRA